MFAPCSANVRATSSSSRGRSHESTAICTRKLCDAPPSQLTGVKRSGLRASALTFGQSPRWIVIRSEEHTSELQSRLHLVCRLLLEKKKTDHILIALAEGMLQAKT